MLVCGPEDGHEAAGPPGAARGPGLPPVTKHNPEGLSREERQADARPAELYRCLFREPYAQTTLPQGLAPHGGTPDPVSQQQHCSSKFFS